MKNLKSSKRLLMNGYDKFLKSPTLGPLNPRTLYLEPQVEQVVAEHVPQEEPAVLLNFPPTDKAKADITR
jgi:hypothetical protein